MTEMKKNLSASVHQRLSNYAKTSNEDFNRLLVRFCNERFLYRLSRSEYKDRFLLKGASLFTLWFNAPHRPTRDIDLLGFGSSETADIEKIFRDICTVESEDGLYFDSKSVKGADIKEGQEYQGVRITLLVLLGKSRINLQIDIGFGDAVSPAAETVEYPTVLDFPKPKLRAYPKETVVAEKFEAMVKLGLTNSRMKDFWDLDVLIREFEFDDETIETSIAATFERRRTAFPKDLPVALTADFYLDKTKQIQWKAFIRKNKLEDAKELEEIINSLKKFFAPIIESFNK